MNVLPPDEVDRLLRCFEQGMGVRETARKTIRDRKTVARYRRKWIDEQLQRAYDLMCEHECDAVDAITATLPDKEAKEMLDAWLDDQCGDAPKSKWF